MVFHAAPEPTRAAVASRRRRDNLDLPPEARAFRGWLRAADASDREAAALLEVSPEWVRDMALGCIEPGAIGPALAVRLLRVTGLSAEDLGLGTAVEDDVSPPPAPPSPPAPATGATRFHLEPTPAGVRIVAVTRGDGHVIEQSWSLDEARGYAAALVRHVALAAAPGSVPA